VTKSRICLRAAVWAVALTATVSSAMAQTGTSPTAKDPKDRSGALGELGSNKAPINIDSDKLDVFDKEGRAVFSGNVVAVQGDSTMRCTSLHVFYESNRGKAGAGGGASGATANAAPSGGSALAAGGMGDNSSIKKIECHGPVTVASKTQVATGDNAEFDRVANRVYLIGNVALSDGPNVTRGDRIVYDLNTGRANVESKPGTGRVRALFVPGSNSDKDKKGGTDKAKPADAKKPAH
jgi:lipopolysaccharide export system protein LptA